MAKTAEFLVFETKKVANCKRRSISGTLTLAHIHLIINHLHILGTLIGVILLFLGLSRGNKVLQRAGLTTLAIVALITIPAFLTGEPAIRKFPGFSRSMAHEHEELGEKGLILP